jgi:cytochrome c oxidase subunit 4
MADESKVEQTSDSGTAPKTPREMKAEATGTTAPAEPAAPVEAAPIVEAAVADSGLTDMRRAHQAAMQAQPPAPKPEPKPEKRHEPMGNTTTLFGRTIPYPIYTVVLGALAIATLFEVLVGTAPHSVVTIPILLAFAIAKATLVVMYYMHLRYDSKIFAFALLLPLFVAFVSLVFLLAVPPTGY